MIKCGTYPPRSFSPDDCYPSGSFATVATTVGPATDLLSGISLGTYTAAYLGGGVYRVTLPDTVSFPKRPWTIQCTAQFDALARAFQASVLGAGLLAGTRTFDIQCHIGTTANEPTSACRVNWSFVASNNTGK